MECVGHVAGLGDGLPECVVLVRRHDLARLGDVVRDVPVIGDCVHQGLSTTPLLGESV